MIFGWDSMGFGWVSMGFSTKGKDLDVFFVGCLLLFLLFVVGCCWLLLVVFVFGFFWL